MAHLVLTHLRNDGARTQVGLGQAIEMAGQVLFNLPLRFDDKPETDAVTQLAGQKTKRKSARIPKWIQHTGLRPQLLKTASGPGQMIGLFLRGAFKLGTQGRLRARQGLRLVQGLSADLANVIDPHQPGAVPPRCRIQRRRVVLRQGIQTGRRPARRNHARDRTQGSVRLQNQRIHPEHRTLLKFAPHFRPIPHR